MPTPDDLAEVIALCRGMIQFSSDRTAVTLAAGDIRDILDAAEAGMNARPVIEELTCGDANAAIRNMALEEAAEKAADVVFHCLGSDGDVVAAAIRALKEKKP